MLSLTIPNCSYSTELVSDEYNGLLIYKGANLTIKALIMIREMCSSINVGHNKPKNNYYLAILPEL